MTFKKSHRGALLAVAAAFLVVGAGAARASTISEVGTLPTPESVVEFSLDLSAAGTIGLQTFGFGGGTNAAGQTIAPGGTDPFVAIFGGGGAAAAILTDGAGNPFGTSLDLANYSGFGGCGPADEEMVGGLPVCGDLAMSLPLAAGAYTVVISDGDYVANAVFDDGTLSEGFIDATTGQFCNLVVNGVNCPNTSGDYALDILDSSPGLTVSAGAPPSPVSEPASAWLLGCGLLALAALAQRKRARGARGATPWGQEGFVRRG